MDCNCEKTPEFPTKAFIPGPIEIPINFRAVTIPADQGDDVANPPQNGAYRNVVLKYAANGHTYIYSSDGIPVMLVGSITFNSLPDRPKYDGQPMTSYTDIPNVTGDIEDIEGDIEDINGDISDINDKIAALATDFSYKGSVEDYAHLPADAATGDVYTTTDTGIIYVWDGNAWVALNEYPSVFVGTDGTSAGEEGLVPAPTVADAGKVLGADGTWVQGGPSVVQTRGTSTTDVMSQDAASRLVYENPTSDNSAIRITTNPILSVPAYAGSVLIGQGANAKAANNSVAIGLDVRVEKNSGIAIGSNSYSSGNTGKGEIAIGVRATAHTESDQFGPNIALGAQATAQGNGNIALGYGAESFYGYDALGHDLKGILSLEKGASHSTTGFEGSKYMIVRGVYDGQFAHDAATVAQGNTLGASAPTTTTEGVLGQLYTDTSSTPIHTYQCTAIDTTDPDNPIYTWTQRW